MIETDNNTIWCGNLAEQVTEELLYELFLQAGPVQRVRIARERNGRLKNFAFITYNHDVSVPYALNLLRGTTLFNKTLTLQCRGQVSLLPPPIRCHGPDPSLDFSNQPTVVQQFANMTENLQEKEHIEDIPRQRENDDKLVMASLQGNWTHRHHPYRAKDQPHPRDNYRSRDIGNYRNRDRPMGNRYDRRYNRKPPYRNSNRRD